MAENKKLANLLEKKEKLENDLAEKRKRLNAEIQKVRNFEASKERKARTRRLIQLGGIVEQVYSKPISDGQLELFKKFLDEQQARGQFLTKALDMGASNEF